MHLRTLFLAAMFVARSSLPAQAQSEDSRPGLDAPGEYVAAGSTDSSENRSAFSAFFVDLGHQFARLPSTSNAITLGIGGALALAAHPADVEVTARAARSDSLDDVSDGGAVAGGGWVQAGSAVGTYLVGHFSNNDLVRELGASLVRAQIVNGVLTQGIKLAVNRTRPDEGRYSFPSGHTSASFATATVLQRYFGWRVALPAYGLATYIGVSRLPENQHYASDVIFGASLGIVAGRTVTVGRGAARFEVSPMAVPHGAGVSVTLVPMR